MSQEQAERHRAKAEKLRWQSLDEEAKWLMLLDPLERITEADLLMDRRRGEMEVLGIARAGAVHQLRESGISVIDIARMLGITRQRVYDLLREATGD